MSRSLLLAAAVATSLSAGQFAAAQTTVATDPVGFTTVASLSDSDTVTGIPFTRPPVFVGAIASVSGSVITVAGSSWAANQFVYAQGTQPNQYYALIGTGGSSNAKEGHMFPVVSNGSNTLTVDTTVEDLSGITPNTQLTLIPYWTLGTLFPASDAGVSFTPTSSSSSYKTQIRIPNYTAAGINTGYLATYYFSNNVDGTSSNVGWRKVGDANTSQHDDDVLLPDTYFVIRNQNGAPALPFVPAGSVLMQRMALSLATSPAQQQDNPVALPRPVSVSLNASGLTPADGSFVSGDQLFLFDNSVAGFDKGPAVTYVYNGGWRLSSDATTDRGNDLLAAGAPMLIRKAPTADGRTVFWVNSPSYVTDLPARLVGAASRKVHGTAGTFDVNLHLTGKPGIECRSGGSNGDYTIVFTFDRAVTQVDAAAITRGGGSVASRTVGPDANQYTVNISGITTPREVDVTLTGVHVAAGPALAGVGATMGVLFGDVNSSRIVDGNDVATVQAATRQRANSANFRRDVNLTGLIDGNDVSAVQGRTRTRLP